MIITYLYAVPFAELRELIGSGDPEALETILRENADLIALANDYPDLEGSFRCEEALADLIHGVKLTNQPAVHYYCACEAIWSHLGELMAEIGGEWTEEADVLLKELDLPLRYGDLFSGEAVVSLPPRSIQPWVGSWPPEVICAASSAFRHTDAEPRPWEEGEYPEEPEELLGLLRYVVEETAERPGWGCLAISY